MKNIAKKILNQYEIKNYTLQAIRETLYNSVYKIVSSDNTYVLRIGNRINQNDLNFETDLINFLSSVDFPCPEIILNSKGENTTLYRNYGAIIFSYIDGVHINISDNLSIEKEKVYRVGKILGLFHDSTKFFKTNYTKSRTLNTELERVIKLKSLFLEKYIDAADFISSIEEALDFIKNNKYELGIVHNDLRSHNIFFDKKKEDIIAVIDYDWACKGETIKDVAHTALEWSFPDGKSEPEFELYKTLVDGYNLIRKNKITLGAELYQWTAISALSDTATYLCDRIFEKPIGLEKVPIKSYMYVKYKYFNNLLKFKK